MAKEVPHLLIQARRHLLVSQGELGVMLGSSRRTGQRWERGGSEPDASQLHALAKLVHPHSHPLAAQIASSGGSTLEALGITLPRPPLPVAPAHPPAPPPPPPADPVHLVDTVVCAAAEAMQVMPEEIRPALRAAFRRARLAGLSLESIERGLGSAPEADGAATPRKGSKGTPLHHG
jgi:hypothetical protein